MSKKDQICCEILSLENEIEFMKEIHKSTKKKKEHLNKLYSQLKTQSANEKEMF